MATAPVYCTHKELKRVYPQIDAFDTKTPIYGWESLGNNVYIAHDTGLVTQLFQDGKELHQPNVLLEIASSLTVYKANITHNLGGVPAGNSNIYEQIAYNASFVKGDEDDLRAGDYIVIWKTAAGTDLYEYAFIESVNTSANQIIVKRGALGKTAATWLVSGDDLFFQDTLRVTDNETWYYDSYLNQILLYSATDPNDQLLEAGEDFTTLVTQFRTDASRYLDSKLDPNLPREQLKDKSGNFDYMIIRSSALIAAAFMIRATDPTNEVATALMEEAQGNIDALNSGNAALSWQTTRDASRGIVRDVSYTDGSVRPVDTRGVYSGTFDLVRVKIETGGALDGTATYSVWVKNSDKLGIQQGNQVVTSEKINGDYQSLAGGLQIRFAGETKTSVATATNEWEIEVMGVGEHIDASGVKSVANSRWLN